MPGIESVMDRFGCERIGSDEDSSCSSARKSTPAESRASEKSLGSSLPIGAAPLVEGVEFMLLAGIGEPGAAGELILGGRMIGELAGLVLRLRLLLIEIGVPVELTAGEKWAGELTAELCEDCSAGVSGEPRELTAGGGIEKDVASFGLFDIASLSVLSPEGGDGRLIAPLPEFIFASDTWGGD